MANRNDTPREQGNDDEDAAHPNARRRLTWKPNPMMPGWEYRDIPHGRINRPIWRTTVANDASDSPAKLSTIPQNTAKYPPLTPESRQ